MHWKSATNVKQLLPKEMLSVCVNHWIYLRAALVLMYTLTVTSTALTWYSV